MLLEAPLETATPRQRRIAPPSEAQAEREGAAFMGFMAEHQQRTG